jgi:hypothetical protein
VSKPQINTPAAELLFELIDGPADPKRTWIVSNAPNTGILGTLAVFTAAEASRPPTLGHKTAAAHAAHLLFALELATKRLQGENPDADWDASWEPSTVGDADWKRMQVQIRDASAALRRVLESGDDWAPMQFEGIIATVGHTAYHLGALRQLLPTLPAKGA